VIEAYPTLVPAPVRQPRQVGAWHQGADGRWSHRPRCKVLINAVLRWLQPWTDRKFVVYTRCATDEAPGEPPRVLGYGFGRVLHLPEPPPATDCDGDGP
jgi:hypothetical protein